MASRSDSLLLVFALVVVALSAATGYFLFGSDTEAAINEQDRGMVGGETAGTAARRSAGPARRGPIEEASEDPGEIVEQSSISLAGPGESILSGKVIDAEAEGIEGADISCVMRFPVGKLNYGLIHEFKAETKTSDSGAFELAVPADAYFDLVVRHPLHAPVIRSEVKSDEKLVIELKPASGMIGHVRSASGGTVVGAQLSFRMSEGRWGETATTDASGRFGVPGLPAGKVLVSVEAPDCLGIEDRLVVLEPKKVLEQDFVLSAGRTIEGTVVDKNGMRIENAEVSCGEIKTMTDIAGRFRIGGLERDKHRIEVVASGFLTHRREVNLRGSREVADVEIEIDRGGRAFGTLLDEAGEPVADAEIKVFETWGGSSSYMWQMEDTRFVTRTDADGNFEIDGLPIANWSKQRARARKEGFADAFSKAFKVSDRDKPERLDMVLRQGGAITGRVVDESGRTLTGVKVSLENDRVEEWNSGGADSRHVMSDEEGRFRFERLSAASYRVSALARGHATAYERNIKVVGAAETEGVELTLATGGEVRGTVKTDEGEPVAGARIRLYSNKSWGYGISDASGNYVVENVGEGPYWLRCRAEGYSRERKSRVFPEDGTIDFELRRDGYVLGQVVESESKTPVREFQVMLQIQTTSGGRTRWRSKSTKRFDDVEGRFKIYAPNGTYRLVVSARGYVEKQVENVALDVDAEPAEVEVEVVAGGALEGWIRDDRGEPVPWCQVYVRKDGDETFRSSQPSERDGYYFVESLEAGSYDVAFHSPGIVPLTTYERVYVVGGDIRRLDHVVRDRTLLVIQHIQPEDGKPAPRYMRVRITAEDGSPLGMSYGGWSRNLRGASARPYSRLSKRLRRGRSVSIRDLHPGSYLLRVEARGFEPYDQRIEIGPDEEVHLPMLLEPKGKKKKSGNTP